uniref:Uncharacterized protein n=1 Tax=Anopheles farauti TaxID=69004 RepID=A0A182Q570_9DIPT
MHGQLLLLTVKRDGELFALVRQYVVHVARALDLVPVDVRYDVARLQTATVTRDSMPNVYDQTAPAVVSEMRRRNSFAWLIGIAKLMPAVTLMLLMPIASPSRLTSGPPELPNVMAASVWM